jgi:hypothetical protein
MKRILFIMVIALITGLTCLGQKEIKIKVQNAFGSGIPNAEVYFCDNSDCQNQRTNEAGEAFFKMPYQPTAIIAYDPAGVYGAEAISIQQSSATYSIQLPFKPKNEAQAGEQMDNIMNKISNVYGYYDDAKFISDALKAVEAGAKTSANLPALGVPGVFSINPIPVVGPDGRLGLKVSGILMDRIMSLWRFSSPMPGRRVYYQYGGVGY